jgi:DNA-binding helix-hairpin-helix protein with protein kinase domain
MHFIHIDLENCQAGDVAEVMLSAGANVRLMDSSNFNAYRNGRQHRCSKSTYRPT